MRLRFAVVVVLLTALPVLAQSNRLPPDLALVPEDGLGFVHVRIADLWRHESMKEMRDVVQKAGDQAVAAVDKRFASLPSNVERLTLWFGRPRSKTRPDGDLVFVVRLSRPPSDAAAVRKVLAPDAEEKKGKRFAWYADAFGAALLIADERTFVLGPKAVVARLADGVANEPGPLREAITIAAENRPLTVGLIVPALPATWLADLRDDTPEPLRPVLAAQSLAASLDLAGEGHLQVRLRYQSATAAEAVEKLLKTPDGPARKLIAEVRSRLEGTVAGDGKKFGLTQVPIAAAALIGIGVLNRAEEVLASDKVLRDGPAIEAAIELPTKSKHALVPAAFAFGAAVAGYASQWRAEITARQTNDLKQLVLALHNYHDTIGQVHPAVVDGNGKPLLSWRVALLPYFEEDNLYRRFKLDEPWDSEHNKKLIEPMPKILAIDGVTAKAGHTHYRTFVGAKATWAFDRAGKIADVVDGTSNTVIFVQAAEPVIWTKPDELEFDGKMEVKSRLLFRDGRTVVGMYDGSVKIVRESIAEDVWKLLIDPADGQILPDRVFDK